MRDSILYYPHIEIQEMKWLKSALLLWDHVYRIVPPSYKPKDSEEVRKACNADLVRPVDLEPEDMYGITQDFQSFLGNMEYKPDGLEYDEFSYLHPEKIDSTLYPTLERYAIGESNEGFILLPKEVVRGYMFFLSTEVARRRRLSRCTDDKYSFAVSSYFSEAANFDDFLYNREALGFYSCLIFENILPFHIENVPIEKIIKASERSRDERHQFKLELERFSEQLCKCESIDHGKTILNDFKKDLVRAKEDLKASQGFLNKKDIGSFLSMGVPTSASVYGALLGAGSDPFGLYSFGASLLIGTIAAYADYRRVQSVQDNPCGAAYLISLEKEFSGTGKYPAFDRYMNEFMND